MTKFILEFVSLGITSSLSPLAIALTIILLGLKDEPKKKALVFLSGSIVVVAILTYLFYFVHNSTLVSTHQNNNPWPDIITGSVLLLLGLNYLKNALSKKNKSNSLSIVEGKGALIKIFIISILINATRFAALVGYIGQLKEISQAQMNTFSNILFVTLGIFFFLFPILFPIIVYLLAPNAAKKITTPVYNVMNKYGNYILAFMMALFGIILLSKGIKLY